MKHNYESFIIYKFEGKLAPATFWNAEGQVPAEGVCKRDAGLPGGGERVAAGGGGPRGHCRCGWLCSTEISKGTKQWTWIME